MPTIAPSEEEDCMIVEMVLLRKEFVIIRKEVEISPSLSAIESGRLTVKLRELLMGVEAERARSSNLKGEVSNRIKRNIKEVLKIADEMDGRLGKLLGAISTKTETVSQLRIEVSLVKAQKKSIRKKCGKLRRKLKKKKATAASVQGEVMALSQKRASRPSSRKTKAIGKRLDASRSSSNADIKSVVAELRELGIGMEVLQLPNREIRIAKRRLQLWTPTAQQTPSSLDGMKERQPANTDTAEDKKKAKKKPRKMTRKRNRKRRIRETAAVSLGVTGAFIWRFKGEKEAVRVERIAKALKKTVLEAKVSRLQRMGTVRLVGINLVLNATIIRNAPLEL
ncbi:PREDICTED: uncharacterized protein LOC106792674 [Polistes canadensis]|uniref:uncharacterized protein LOC106792674 n=1 Tax=Polistes canadensis TaxID=91411 RepID=UPI000718DCF3|nr:PREDICTED: uncharacterized protein LOC106792674 [Polistes canadensis]